MKFETVRILVLGEVFVAVAVVEHSAFSGGFFFYHEYIIFNRDFSSRSRIP